jgi:hypothetical protein
MSALAGPCRHQVLRNLTFVARSSSGNYVYCLCACGTQRMIPAPRWSEEEERRAKEQRLQEAAATLGRPRTAHSYPLVRLTQTELGCCAAWHPVTTLPFVCPTCGRYWLWPGVTQ